jgi:hypothetical protein
MSEPVAAAATPAEAAAPIATAATDASSSSSAASTSAPAPLPPTDNLTKMMIDKSIHTLSTHKALGHRGLAILYRNLFAILFGPMFAQSWETTILREEQKSTKDMFRRTNVESLKRMKVFFQGKKARAKSGSCLSLAIINPSSKIESFEHRMLLIWLGAPTAPRLFKLDGMKRDGILGLTKEQTSWPAALTELPNEGADLWAALQVFITDSNPKVDWDRSKQHAWDVIVSRPSGSMPFASRIELKGPQTFCVVTNDEEGLAVDLKNGLVERLKAISMQLESM